MNLFGIEKISVGDCQELTIESLKAHAYPFDHWVIALSGGKDSTTVTTLIIYLILSGQIEAPKSLTIEYADTRQELLPLYISTLQILDQIRALAGKVDFELNVEIVQPEIDQRFMVYMFGRGVPPPNNTTLRWCTRNIKKDPMESAIAKRFENAGEKVLTITGVRLGESAVRDGRISMSCSRDGAECGQGWFQNELNSKYTATLAPIIHWRVCNVWDWLMYFAPLEKYGGWDTQLLALAYGGDKAREKQTRTGCNGCPLVDKDTALDGVLEIAPDWGYIAPLKGLRPIYREMRSLKYRLRKHGERKKNGELSSNPNRVGPLTIEARRMFLARVLAIQEQINTEADRLGHPRIDFINQEEIDRIHWHWENNIWPDKWDGGEALATEPYQEIYSDGTIQTNLFGN